MTRFAPPTLAAVFFAVAFATSTPVAAQELPTLLTAAQISTAALELDSPPTTAPAAAEKFETARPRRPDALMPLYLLYATLQALDIHSTMRALDRGAVEANPLMKNVTASPASLVAVKAAGAAGVLYTTEQLWKKNPTAAVMFMIAANSGMAWVVQHNYQAGGEDAAPSSLTSNQRGPRAGRPCLGRGLPPMPRSGCAGTHRSKRPRRCQVFGPCALSPRRPAAR